MKAANISGAAGTGSHTTSHAQDVQVSRSCIFRAGIINSLLLNLCDFNAADIFSWSQRDEAESCVVLFYCEYSKVSSIEMHTAETTALTTPVHHS